MIREAEYRTISKHIQTDRAALLRRCGLGTEEDVDYTVILTEEEHVVGCGSLRGNLLLQIANYLSVCLYLKRRCAIIATSEVMRFFRA